MIWMGDIRLLWLSHVITHTLIDKHPVSASLTVQTTCDTRRYKSSITIRQGHRRSFSQGTSLLPRLSFSLPPGLTALRAPGSHESWAPSSNHPVSPTAATRRSEAYHHSSSRPFFFFFSLLFLLSLAFIYILLHLGFAISRKTAVIWEMTLQRKEDHGASDYIMEGMWMLYVFGRCQWTMGAWMVCPLSVGTTSLDLAKIPRFLPVRSIGACS